MTEFKEVIQIDPNRADAHHNLGVVYQTQGKLDKAIEAYETALQIDPNLAQAHYNLGQCLSNAKEQKVPID